MVCLTGFYREASIMKRPTRVCCAMGGGSNMSSTVILLRYLMYSSNYLLESSIEKGPEEHTFYQSSGENECTVKTERERNSHSRRM